MFRLITFMNFGDLAKHIYCTLNYINTRIFSIFRKTSREPYFIRVLVLQIFFFFLEKLPSVYIPALHSVHATRALLLLHLPDTDTLIFLVQMIIEQLFCLLSLIYIYLILCHDTNKTYPQRGAQGYIFFCSED